MNGMISRFEKDRELSRLPQDLVAQYKKSLLKNFGTMTDEDRILIIQIEMMKKGLFRGFAKRYGELQIKVGQLTVEEKEFIYKVNEQLNNMDNVQEGSRALAA